MAPANRPPARGRRRPAVAGTRGPGTDRATRDARPADEAATADAPEPGPAADTGTTDPGTTDPGTTDTPTADAPTTETAAVDTPTAEDTPAAAGPDLRKAGPKAKVRAGAARPRTVSRPVPAAGGATSTTATPAAPAATGRRGRPVRALLALAAVLVVGALVVGVLALVRAGQASSGDVPTSNVALIDDAATAEASAATVTILQTAYSYSWTTVDADLAAAVALMTPEMAAQHRASFDSIRQTVTDSKTTTKATVVANGVRLLDGDRAEAIAFVTVAGDNDGTALQTAGYRFTANLLRVDGSWQLSGLAES